MTLIDRSRLKLEVQSTHLAQATLLKGSSSELDFEQLSTNSFKWFVRGMLIFEVEVKWMKSQNSMFLERTVVEPTYKDSRLYTKCAFHVIIRHLLPVARRTK